MATKIKTDRACAFPCRTCAGYVTEKATLKDADIRLLTAVTKGADGSYKALTDAAKFDGVTVYDAKANTVGDVMVAGQVNIDGINIPDGMKATDLVANNSNLILRREV